MRCTQRAAAFALLTFPLSALACSFAGLEHEVRFRRDDTVLEAVEVRRLADWYIGKREGLKIGGVDIFAKAERGGPASLRKARARVAGVTRLLVTLGARAPLPVHTSIETIDRSPRQATKDLDTVVVGVQPACVKSSSCCISAVTS